jgi:hypothetical protein
MHEDPGYPAGRYTWGPMSSTKCVPWGLPTVNLCFRALTRQESGTEIKI